MNDAAGGVLPAVGTPVIVIPMVGGDPGSGRVSVVEAARPVEENEGKINWLIRREISSKKLTLSIALLVRTSLDSFFSFLALRVNAFLANAILDAAQAGARIITLLACLLTIGAGVFDLTTLGTNLRLRGANHTRSERIHVHGQTTVGSRMHSQLRLNRVRGGLGGIDSVIVRVSTDRSHVWEGKEGRVSQCTTEGVAEGEEGMNGQRAGEVRAWRQSTWQQLASNSDMQKEGGTREKGSKAKGKRKGETFSTTGRKEKEARCYKGGEEEEERRRTEERISVR